MLLTLSVIKHLGFCNGDDFMALTEAGATADTYVVVDKFGDFGPDPGSGFDIAGVSSAPRIIL